MSELASSFSNCVWPVSRLGEALDELGLRSGLTRSSKNPANPPPGIESRADDALESWLAATCAGMGLEAEPVGARYPEVEALLREAAPTLVLLPGGTSSESSFLVLLGGGRRRVKILGPDLTVRRLSLETVRRALCRELEEPLWAAADAVAAAAGLRAGRRRQRATSAVLSHQLNETWVRGCWLLRHAPGAPFWRQLRWSRAPARLLGWATSYLLYYLLFLLSWWMIGRAALQGRFDRGWLLAWGLALVTLVPLRLLTIRLGGSLNLVAAGLLKQRLLHGALMLEPEEIRHQGAGQLLARVLESEAFQILALSGGLATLLAVGELVLAGVVLTLGAGGLLHAALLALWWCVSLLLGWRYYRRRRTWTVTRLALTSQLVEAMVGYRTRLAQQPRESWHEGEDAGLHGFLEASRAMDSTAGTLAAVVPRGWLVLGIAGLAPAFVSAAAPMAGLAVALGGVLLGYRALTGFARGLVSLAGAGIALQEVEALLAAASRPQVRTLPDTVIASRSGDGRSRLLDAAELSFTYSGRAEPALKSCSLRINDGDHLLLQGRSGSGKSTLVSLLSGLRVPQSGLVLLRGWDRQSLGSDEWRRRVVAAPQFHENHVLAESFAFNLLMSRRWPPQAEDLREAEAVCRALGLGPLLDRMPAGLFQMVGETGWQLSHGERNRLYVARALLQDADLVILDESFAALDPESLQTVLAAVLRRAPTLLLVGHF